MQNPMSVSPMQHMQPMAGMHQQQGMAPPARGPPMAAPRPPEAEPEAPMDSKTALNQFCQRLCQRPVTRVDIEYTVNKIGVQFQAIVKLNCIQGQEFAGELAASPKDAEKAAAEQALKAHKMTIATLPPTQTGRQKKKDKASAAAKTTDPDDQQPPKVKLPEEENPALTAKVKLNSLCMRIVKRALQKGETNYETVQRPGGFQCILTLTCLPEPWSMKAWTGKVCTTKQAAEQSAAAYALEEIEADADLESLAIAKEKKDSKGEPGSEMASGSSSGKGYGKKGKWEAFEEFAASMPAWMQPKPSGPDLARDVLPGGPHSGQVLDWRPGNKFGWLQTDEAVDHPKGRRDGKVYCHVQDVTFDPMKLEPATKVNFELYVDTAGLGAQRVTLG